MAHQRSKSNGHSPWKLILALLCISLVIACGTIQAVHVHPNGDISRADCPLCATAHVAIQIVESPATSHVAPVVAIIDPTLPGDSRLGPRYREEEFHVLILGGLLEVPELRRDSSHADWSRACARGFAAR